MKNETYLIEIINETHNVIEFKFVNPQVKQPFETKLKIVGLPEVNFAINCYTSNGELMQIAWEKDVAVRLLETIAKDTEEIYTLYVIVDGKFKNYHLLSRYTISDNEVIELL